MTVIKRKLIEVALPLEAINRESAREKSIRHGHPSTLHLWWARRPLAACRAVIFAQLVDDPSAHPEEFPSEADQARERQRLFDIIERLVVWENCTDENLLNEARQAIMKSTGGQPPPLLDPFAGGGSIPLEAQRMGLETWASDLNPIPVLINKALVEIPPKWTGMPPVYPGTADERLSWPGATGLAEDIRRYGLWMRDEAERRIGWMYPKAVRADGTATDVIAWIWSRTVICANPACGIQMPLVRSWWLGKKKGKEAFVVPSVELDDEGKRVVRFEIGHDPKLGPTKANDGTVTRDGAVCVACGSSAPLTYVRAEGQAGRMGAQLMAIAAQGARRRDYLPADALHIAAASIPAPTGLPEGELADNVWDIKVKNYGLTHVSDLFTDRQLVALTTLGDLIAEAHAKALIDARMAGLDPDDVGLEAGGAGAQAFADSVALYLAFCVDRVADRNSTLCGFDSSPKVEGVRNVFARQALSMVWDFGEGNPFGSGGGNIGDVVEYVKRTVERLPGGIPGVVTQADAATRSYVGGLVCTDPPYYDNVGYANLSDFFYVWLRRSLRDVFPGLLATVVTPKADELVADPYRHGGREQAGAFFEDGFTRVFAAIRETTPQDFPITVFYAFKQSDSDDDGTVSTGWQTLLEGMLKTGWEVTSTWPIRTELANRIKAQETNSLASSIVLSLRPRPDAAGPVTRRSFIAALKSELPGALRDLQQGSIAPVDLAQAAIGPGMRVFSRHSRVTEVDGSDMSVRTALAIINQVLDEVLADQEGDFDVETRFCVKWFTQFGWNEAAAGEADVLSRAVNTSVSQLERGGVFRAAAGKARLIEPSEMSPVWNPAEDKAISVWEVAVRVASALQREGAERATQWMTAASTRVDMDAVKELTYLMYSVCEKKNWTESAVLFNGLGTSWSDLTAASRGPKLGFSTQGELDLDGDE